MTPICGPLTTLFGDRVPERLDVFARRFDVRHEARDHDWGQASDSQILQSRGWSKCESQKSLRILVDNISRSANNVFRPYDDLTAT